MSFVMAVINCSLGSTALQMPPSGELYFIKAKSPASLPGPFISLSCILAIFGVNFLVNKGIQTRDYSKHIQFQIYLSRKLVYVSQEAF